MKNCHIQPTTPLLPAQGRQACRGGRSGGSGTLGLGTGSEDRRGGVADIVGWSMASFARRRSSWLRTAVGVSATVCASREERHGVSWVAGEWIHGGVGLYFIENERRNGVGRGETADDGHQTSLMALARWRESGGKRKGGGMAVSSPRRRTAEGRQGAERGRRGRG